MPPKKLSTTLSFKFCLVLFMLGSMIFNHYGYHLPTYSCHEIEMPWRKAWSTAGAMLSCSVRRGLWRLSEVDISWPPHRWLFQFQEVTAEEKLGFTSLRAIHGGLLYLPRIHMLYSNSVLTYFVESTSLRPDEQHLTQSVAVFLWPERFIDWMGAVFSGKKLI